MTCACDYSLRRLVLLRVRASVEPGLRLRSLGTRSRSRRDGFESEYLGSEKMRLLGHLTNPPSSLQAVFNALPDEPIEPMARPESPVATGRLGNGVVQRAIVKVLASADRPMRLRDIHSAVEDRLGQAVSKESVSWCLRRSRSGDELRFERVAFGSYRLMPQT
jgi:hypothetical protein